MTFHVVSVRAEAIPLGPLICSPEQKRDALVALALPLMPACRMLLPAVRISENTAKKYSGESHLPNRTASAREGGHLAMWAST